PTASGCCATSSISSPDEERAPRGVSRTRRRGGPAARPSWSGARKRRRARAQHIVLREPGPERVAAIVRPAAERQHTLRAGSGDLVLPRDSTIPGNLLVLGRRTYLSSHVEGDVIVVGVDLFLRPLSSISGRAIAIVGGVYSTPLGRVGG